MKTRRPSPPDVTPAGKLAESSLHFVLGYQLAQAAIVTSHLFTQHAGDPFELRPVEYTVLTLIDENPGGSLARLARALAVTAPHITAIVDRLEARGLIERSQSQDDRRSQVLRTSAGGAELVRTATAQIVAAEKAALSHLTVGEHTLLLELLHKVACARQPPR